MPSSLWHKKKQRKKSTALLLKKGGFVSVSLIGIWELSYATPSSLWKLCGDERNPQPPLSLKRTVCISLPCGIDESCSKCRTPSLLSFAVTNGKIHPTLSKKGRFVYVTLVGIWELSYAAPSSLGQKMKQRKKSYGSNNDCSTV